MGTYFVQVDMSIYWYEQNCCTTVRFSFFIDFGQQKENPALATLMQMDL